MAGTLVPAVMIPRYTAYSGATAFRTIGMDVTEYQTAILNVWRGQILGGGSTSFLVNCEESTDQNIWSICSGTTEDDTVTEDQEKQFTATLKKRWFRLRIETTGTAPVVSCWAVGFLEDRQQ